MNRTQRDDPLARLRPAGERAAPAPAGPPGGGEDGPVLQSRGRHRTGAAPTFTRAVSPSGPAATRPGEWVPPPGAASLVALRRLLGPVAVTVISAVLTGGLLWWWFSAEDDQGFVLSAAATSAPAPGVSDTPAGSPPVAGGPASASEPVATPGPAVTVHVAGAVATPGVVVVPGSSRVVDAVAAAGGLTADAAPDGVNLARQVLDGELVVVPTPGQLPMSPAAPGGATQGTAAAGGPAGQSGGLIDLNRADVPQLDTLPGIGPVLAERIVGYREDTGPFADVEDLRSVPGIGDKVFGDIRDLVTV